MKDKHIFINHRLIVVTTILTLIALFLIFFTFDYSDIRAIDIIVLSLCILMILCCIIIMPHCCILTQQGVTIKYVFGLKETAEWKEIRKIYVIGVPGVYLSYADGYQFVGIKGSKTFFMSGEFYKSKKFTEILEYYAKNKIRK